MVRAELLESLRLIRDSKLQSVAVIGAGTLGQAYVELLLRRTYNHVIFYNRTFSKALAAFKDARHAVAGAEMDFDDAAGADDIRPGVIVNQATMVRDGETEVYVYGIEPDTGEAAKVVITSDPRVVAAMIKACSTIYYTLGRSEHMGGKVQIDRDLSIIDNMGILADMVPKLGLAHAKKAIHIVTSNPDNLVVKAYADITSLPPDRVIAVGTSVDSARLATVLADEYDISVGAIKKPVVMGNHGPDMLIVPQVTQVLSAFSPADGSVLPERQWMSLGDFVTGYVRKTGFDSRTMNIERLVGLYLDEIRDRTARAGGEILKGKTEGTAQGPAQAAYKVASILGGGTKSKMVLTVAMPTDLYGISENVWLGHLVEIEAGNIRPIELQLTNEQKEALQQSAKKLDSLFREKRVQKLLEPAKKFIETVSHKDIADGNYPDGPVSGREIVS